MRYEVFELAKSIHTTTELKDVGIIAAQHLMDSTLEVARALLDFGVAPNAIHLIGKAYSSSNETYNRLLELGISVSADSFKFDSHLPYDETYSAAVQLFAKNAVLSLLKNSNIEKLIVIDDGGTLIKTILDLDPPLKVVAVEQTSSGYNTLKTLPLTCPVINVARSKSKLKIETPFITESILSRFHQLIPARSLLESNVLILGSGVIGRSIQTQLKNAFSVTVIDTALPKSDGAFRNLLKTSSVIIGCSGFQSLPFRDYRYLPQGAVLLSSSSSDREFEAYKFRRQLARTSDPHTNFQDGGITLLQSGFPINFWNTPFNISLKYMQLTMSLILSGILQAFHLIGSAKTGFIDFDEEIERQLVQKLHKILYPDLVCSG